MQCRWCGRRLHQVGNAWAHDGLGETISCLGRVLEAWLWPAGLPPVDGEPDRADPAVPDGSRDNRWGAEAIVADLAAATEMLGLAADGLSAAVDGASAATDRPGSETGGPAGGLPYTIEGYRSEIRIIAEQLAPVTAMAGTLVRLPTPSAAATTLSTVLAGISTLSTAVLRTDLLSTYNPGALADSPQHVLAQLAESRDLVATAAIRLDQAREKVVATLTATNLAGAGS